ncbi:unnamed protein product [Protopolystoma xenopodis]|uniref:Uncharacterized protein n=1 Tax=Protopolystoma xenopodis TaxID=117903 RepID=A0A448WQP6_9PLAT|nr:unnamed protein product [Protopolystoma xenopodis]
MSAKHDLPRTLSLSPARVLPCLVKEDKSRPLPGFTHSIGPSLCLDYCSSYHGSGSIKCGLKQVIPQVSSNTSPHKHIPIADRLSGSSHFKTNAGKSQLQCGERGQHSLAGNEFGTNMNASHMMHSCGSLKMAEEVSERESLAINVEGRSKVSGRVNSTGVSSATEQAQNGQVVNAFYPRKCTLIATIITNNIKNIIKVIHLYEPSKPIQFR